MLPLLRQVSISLHRLFIHFSLVCSICFHILLFIGLDTSGFIFLYLEFPSFTTEVTSLKYLKPPVVYSTDRSKPVVLVSVLVLLLFALWLILQGDLFYVLPCVILFLCFSVLLALRLPRLGNRELILVLIACLFDLYLFGSVCFLLLLVSGKGCDL